MEDKALLKKMMNVSPQYLEAMSNGWMVQNLRKYGNSVVPKDVLKIFGHEGTEEILSRILGEPVELVRDMTSKQYTVWVKRRIM